MSLQGLPDFHRPLRGEGCTIYYPFEGAGSHTLTPERLEVANRPDGRPDFTLHFVRGKNPALPPAPYGFLSLRVCAHFDLEKAFQLLRARRPGATLAPCSFTGGWLRLQPIKGVLHNIPKELLRPIPLAWNGLGVALYSLKVSPGSASLLMKSLKGEQLAFHALAELEMAGVSPRLPLQVRFDPAELWRALESLADDKHRMVRDQVVELFGREPCKVRLDISGDTENLDRLEFAEAITDRVRIRFGEPAFAPKIGAGGCFALTGGSPGEGSYSWDLAQPFRALRPLTLYLHPLEAARKLVEKEGEDFVVSRIEVPPLEIGCHSIHVSANLPEELTGIYGLGVTIDVPSKMPFRPQAVVETVELSPPNYEGDICLRLSPNEALECGYFTYVVWESEGCIQQLEGRPKPCREERLELAPDDFPVAFVSIQVSKFLAKIVSKAKGTLRWKMDGSPAALPFELKGGKPTVTLVYPRGAQEVTLDFVCWSLEGDRMVQIGPLPALDFTLGLHAFPEYGPHTIKIECEFPEGAELCAIDLLPENVSDAAGEITVHFTPDRPTREWLCYAKSPFYPGYKYRRHASSDETAEPWSAVQSPDRPLQIQAKAASRIKVAGGDKK